MFTLSKWYMDCVSDEGEAVIVYAACLRWRALTFHYASVLVRPPGQAARTETSLRASGEPEIDGATLRWSSPALGVSGTWRALAPAAEVTVYASAEGEVRWKCHQPRSEVELTVGGWVIKGRGYAEHLEVTVPPWSMPIDELRWGRFVGERHALVWIDWRGAHEKQVVLLDGTDVGPAAFEDRSVTSHDGTRLEIEEAGALREGTIGATALAHVPGIERFPARILALDEHKWCARGTLSRTGEDEDHGWVIHEVVKWPARAAARGGTVGKVAYGAVFAAVLPVLLVLWARAAERSVQAPAVHAPTLGMGLTALGALLMVAGWVSLWRDGGGLPMNAFPPPRLVTRGVYAWLGHPIYVGFTAMCFGLSLATGSASGLWLVSPGVALGALALVLGYEALDLDERFGRGSRAPWLGVPPASDERPSLARRVGFAGLTFLPWLLLCHGEAAWLPGVLGIAGAGATLVPHTENALRRVTVHSLAALTLLAPLHLVTGVTPAYPAAFALVLAEAITSGARTSARAAVGVGVAVGAFALWRSNLVGVSASIAGYLLAANVGRVWEAVRAVSERVANSWQEVRVGPVRIINHSVWAWLASLGGIAMIAVLAGPGNTPAIVVGAGGGLIGAGLWAQTIEGSPSLSRPYGFYGGLVGICLTVTLAAPLLGSSTWLLLGATSVAAPYIQGVGRFRCLVQGCCHGSETVPAIGIRYRHPRSRVCRLAHLEDVPIHPTPVYSMLCNVVTFVVVARLWSVHAMLHLIGGVYLMLSGLGRFCEEAYRGEPQTPVFGRLRLYQWFAIAQVVIGAVLTAVGRSGPAPTPHVYTAALVVAAVYSVIYGAALGVDFPDSARRFSRLA